MDFPEKDGIPWPGLDPSAAKVGQFDCPWMCPDFAFPGLAETPLFYMPDPDFQMYQVKKEEETDMGNPMFFCAPEFTYNLSDHNDGRQDWPDPSEKPMSIQSSQSKAPQISKLRVPYPHAKKVGTITIEERRLKIERYLEKRSRRNYGKKVAYACRKRVADTRIRVKGRFVAKNIAEALKGLENKKNNVSLQSLK